MDASDDRSTLEKYAPSLFGLVLGLIGLVIAEFVLHEVWPTFAGLFAGMALGALASLILARRRRARSDAHGHGQDRETTPKRRSRRSSRDKGTYRAAT